MFNEEIKRQFIDYYAKTDYSKNKIWYMFKAFEPYERAWGTDLSEVSAEKLQTPVNNILGIRKVSKRTDIIVLQEYAKWCIKKGIKTATLNILSVDKEGLEKVKRQTVSSPLHLQKFMDDVFESENKETVDIVYRCYLWLAYGGMPENQTGFVKTTDINFNDLIISYDKYEIPIYQYAIPVFKKAVMLNDFAYFHPNYSDSIRRDRIPGNLLLRGVRGQSKSNSMREYVSRRIGKVEKEGDTQHRLSYRRIWLSGMFYRTLEMERAGYTHTNFVNIILQENKGGNHLSNSRLNRKLNDIKDDYRRWKNAYLI